MRKPFTALLLSLLVFVFLGVGCRSDKPKEIKRADETTLKLLYWQAPTILNPHIASSYKDAEASRITLEPLASFDANGKWVLFLASEVPSLENGGIAPDGTAVTWKLKRNIRWSDGTPFTAQDVAFTYKLISHPEVVAVTVGSYERVKSVEALDDHTVKINFKTPNPGWSLCFTGTEGMILPAHVYQGDLGSKIREAKANLHPVGTGPYRVVTFKPGDTVIYEPNPYYREPTQLAFKRIELKGGGEATAAARAVLQTGDADFAYNIQVEAPVLKQLSTGDRGQVVISFGSIVEQILINFTDPNRATAEGERSSLQFPHPFLSDLKVRQAFNLAIDRDTIAKQLYGEAGKGTTDFLVAPARYRSSTHAYQYDLAAAARLLDAAGWRDTNGNGIRDRNGIEMQVLFTTSTNPLRQKTQEIIKQSLQAIGVEVELKSLDPVIYFSSDATNVESFKHFYADLEMLFMSNNHPDPTAYLRTYTCQEIAQKANNWSKQNYSRYCNPAYDRLWQQLLTELDPGRRTQLFRQMNDFLVKDLASLPIVHRADIDAVSHRLTGVNLTPWDRHTWNIADWSRPPSTPIP